MSDTEESSGTDSELNLLLMKAYRALSREVIATLEKLSSLHSTWSPEDEWNKRTISWLICETKKVMVGSQDTNYLEQLLLWAARNGYNTVVEVLLEMVEIDGDARDKYGQTALSLAAEKGHDDTVEVLLKSDKVTTDTKDYSGRTPLQYAAKSGQEAAVRMILETGKASINRMDTATPLGWAARNGHEGVVKLLLEADGVDVNSRDSEFRQTPLDWATEKEHYDVVARFLEAKNIRIDTKDGFWRSLLLDATEKGCGSIVKLLIETGKVDLNVENFFGVLSRAAYRELDEIIELILQTTKLNRSLYTELRSSYERALLQATRGYLGAFKMLTGTGMMDMSPTALQEAAGSGHDDIVLFLIATGKVDVDSKDGDGQTPLQMAARYGHYHVVLYLLATNQVDMHWKDSSGRTALEYATQNRHKAVVDLLLEVAENKS